MEAELSRKSLLKVARTFGLNESNFRKARADAISQEQRAGDGSMIRSPRASIHLVRGQVSPWARCGAKRFFDCACILPFTPVLIPLFLLVGIAVRVTSTGPVLFLQRRMGRRGRIFTIIKFRTLTHCGDDVHRAVTTSANQRFTPVGRFLRRWKLDELPQLWNVLVGDMSLVGARPKLPIHQIGELECRPGITGAATIAFAREEALLARLPMSDLDGYYNAIILPFKHRIDEEYMAQATFLSDLKLLVDTVLRRWDTSLMESLLQDVLLEEEPASRTVLYRKSLPVLGDEGELNREEQLTEA